MASWLRHSHQLALLGTPTGLTRAGLCRITSQPGTTHSGRRTCNRPTKCNLPARYRHLSSSAMAANSQCSLTTSISLFPQTRAHETIYVNMYISTECSVFKKIKVQGKLVEIDGDEMSVDLSCLPPSTSVLALAIILIDLTDSHSETTRTRIIWHRIRQDLIL
jgi:hypothetical protein